MRWSGNLEPVFYASWVSLILLPLIKLYVPVEAIRAHVDLFATHKVPTGPALFQEAPAFRNGIHCLPSSVDKSEAESVCDATAVHIAMTLDAVYLRGSMAAILSIVQHSDCPENLIFHFLVSHGDVELKTLLRNTFPYLRFKVYYFDVKLVKDLISASVRQDLEQPLNYARSYLAEILETCIQRVIYLDSDLIVVDDIAKLWGTSLGSHTLGAPEYCHVNFTKYFTPSFWSNSTLASTFETRIACYFNTGVMVIDLTKWRQQNYTRRIEMWMEIQKEKRIYELGSLPPFLLVFAGFVEPIEHRWNQHGLGGDNAMGSCRHLHPGPVSLLHWSGKGKPWLRLDSGHPCPIDSLWAPYDLFIKTKYADE
ncbi:hypothetical protein O6H91_09G099500 [Diphasiastrum complanatum]|uniref:Uncharacterized protein n=2 Tax=Diphasiastrum complanatum TaxID=34168 RepID=A0ACC2CS93_DIPCM|nr:hypothetical protein O6H91_09G099500 [Diphasiastrum complanatum]KAJ7544934.1 hypothetical protein O6H91_09G099500 [Diphasiastrum complanatum]